LLSLRYLGIPEELRGQTEVVPNGSARRASVGLLRLFGYSPEGDTSLPLVRKPPDPGNNTTILFSSDAPASISYAPHFANYPI